jgi:hypothetical protein
LTAAALVNRVQSLRAAVFFRLRLTPLRGLLDLGIAVSRTCGRGLAALRVTWLTVAASVGLALRSKVAH